MTKPVRYFKVLNADRTPAHGGTGKWKARGWMPTIPDPIPCQRGWHLCREQDLVFWLGEAIWEAEPGDVIIEHGSAATNNSKVVTERARLLHRLPWDERTARLFAADCAEHVAKHADPATRKVIRATLRVVRRYVDGQATDVELDAARGAAWAAAEAAWDAAEAAWDAAGAAERRWQTRRLMTYLYPKEER